MAGCDVRLGQQNAGSCPHCLSDGSAGLWPACCCFHRSHGIWATSPCTHRQVFTTTAVDLLHCVCLPCVFLAVASAAWPNSMCPSLVHRLCIYRTDARQRIEYHVKLSSHQIVPLCAFKANPNACSEVSPRLTLGYGLCRCRSCKAQHP